MEQEKVERCYLLKAARLIAEIIASIVIWGAVTMASTTDKEKVWKMYPIFSLVVIILLFIEEILIAIKQSKENKVYAKLYRTEVVIIALTMFLLALYNFIFIK